MATFRGNEFFSYNLSLSPIQSSVDEITLSFRTLQRNGLLLHTGRSADYVNLSLRNAALWLVINLGSGAFEALVEPTSGKFNDNNWHDVRVTRNRRQVGPRLRLSCGGVFFRAAVLPGSSLVGQDGSPGSHLTQLPLLPGCRHITASIISASVSLSLLYSISFCRAHLLASGFMNGC